MKIFLFCSLLLAVPLSGPAAWTASTFDTSQATPSKVAPADVRTAQERLNDLGYSAGPVNGVFGTRTSQALRRYQRDNDQTITGWLDPATLATLGVRPTIREQQAGVAAPGRTGGDEGTTGVENERDQK